MFMKRRRYGYRRRRTSYGRGAEHKFNRRWAVTFTPSGGVARGSVAPALSLLTNYSEFQALFDQYKITYIVTTVTLITDPSTAPSSAGERLVPRMLYCMNYDDAVTVDSNTLRERQGCQVRYLRMGVPIRITCRPKMLSPVYTGNSNGQLAAGPGRFVGTGDPSTPHFAWNYAIDNIADTSRVHFEHKLYFRCRGVQ
jgi:hypothetical protein